MGWQKLLMILVNIVFVKENINQVLLIWFTKLVNCTFAAISTHTDMENVTALQLQLWNYFVRVLGVGVNRFMYAM